MAACGIDPDEIDSVVFVEAGVCYLRSDAALRVAGYLSAPWRWLSAVHVVPRPARDYVYDWIARHRYRWFGTRAACRIPTPETRARFLDADEVGP